jgi:general secretion pathway protein H
MSVNKGFTLIEILVVIVIIGITVGFSLIAFGDFGESKRIIFAAEQLENTLLLAQQQAILESSTLGLYVDNKSYQILKFQNGSRWHALSSKSLFKPHYFPKDMIINLKPHIKANKNSPPMIINSSGETNAFTLNFGTLKEKTIAVLTGKENGELTFTTATKK